MDQRLNRNVGWESSEPRPWTQTVVVQHFDQPAIRAGASLGPAIVGAKRVPSARCCDWEVGATILRHPERQTHRLVPSRDDSPLAGALTRQSARWARPCPRDCYGARTTPGSRREWEEGCGDL